jgi:hypothetical protein
VKKENVEKINLIGKVGVLKRLRPEVKAQFEVSG